MKRSLVLLAAVVTAACSAESPIPAQTSNPLAPTVAASSLQPQSSPTAQTTVGEDAVRLVLASWGGTAPPFPASVGSRACEIHGGGPPPGMLLRGVCRTEVEKTGSDYVVKFTQMWDARDFRHAGDPNTGELSYTWSFIVSGTGDIAAQIPYGNFPPQYVK